MALVSITDSPYFADPTGATDSTAAIAACTAANKGVRWPLGLYLVSGNNPLVPQNGGFWQFDGPTIYHPTTTQTTLNCTGVTDFNILGRVRIAGSGLSANTAVGVRVNEAKRYYIEGILCDQISGVGFDVVAGVFSGNYADRYGFIDCAARQCDIGRRISAGTDAEYTYWRGWNAVGNNLADSIAAGNTLSDGGMIVENVNGVLLSNGSNHGHGTYSNFWINHNTGYSIKAVGVTLGYGFRGCHIYANNSTTGKIWVNGSQGINLSNCFIDAPIQFDGSCPGPSFWIGNSFAGANANTRTGADIGLLKLRANNDFTSWTPDTY